MQISAGIPSRRRALAAAMAAAVIAFAGPALASGGGEGGEGGKEEISSDLEILNIPLPVQRGGKLINYLYISTDLKPAPKRDIWKMRESTHFLRENIILAGHRADFSDPANPEKLDTKRAIAMVQAEAEKVYGKGAFAKVDITTVDSKRTGIAKMYAAGGKNSPQP